MKEISEATVLVRDNGLFFPVAQELLAETRIEAYAVSLIDTFDRESVREVLLLTERPGEQAQMA